MEDRGQFSGLDHCLLAFRQLADTMEEPYLITAQFSDMRFWARVSDLSRSAVSICLHQMVTVQMSCMQ